MFFVACLLLTSVVLPGALGQMPGSQKDNGHPPLSISVCTGPNSCQTQQKSIVLDANWMWVHKVGTYTNCYTGNVWDKTDCPDPKTCAQNCALDTALNDYPGTYGITAQGADLQLNFVTHGPYSTNVGSRSYLMDTDSQYMMFKLKNHEFTFDADDSNMPCGLNGALYFVAMDADGGMSKYPGNKAGAKYGTGYCDAQCPHDIKFINGEANILNWTTTSKNSGNGKYGSCCTEMDIWESNLVSQALTPHSCVSAAYRHTRCSGINCGDNSSGNRQNGWCDKDGSDWNDYRLGNHKFYGPGSSFTINSMQPVTVVTQFITSDGTDSGDLSEIKRHYIQNGKRVEMSTATINGKTFNSITDTFTNAQKSYFGDVNGFEKRGGLRAVGNAMEGGMVLVMSLWDDYSAYMLWLDSDYPVTEPVNKPGVARGTCATSSGRPADVESKYPNSHVKYMNIKYGPIGSTIAFE